MADIFGKIIKDKLSPRPRFGSAKQDKYHENT